MSSSSHKNNMPKVSHYSTLYFLRYTNPIYMKYLFTNIQKQYIMVKSSLRFKKNIWVNNLRFLRFKNAKFSGYCF